MRAKLIATMLAASVVSPAMAEDITLATQYLPKAEAALLVTETLLTCPVRARAGDPAVPPRIRASGQIVVQYAGDRQRPFPIVVETGFWSSRSMEIALTEDGRLNSVNMSTEGAGGAALGSLFRSIARLATLATGLPSSAADAGRVEAPLCLPEVAERVRLAERTRQEIIQVEHRVALAAGDEAARMRARLEGLRASLATHERALTLTSAVQLDPVTRLPATSWTAFARPPPYNRWFGEAPLNLDTPTPDDRLVNEWRAAIATQWRLGGVYGYGIRIALPSGSANVARAGPPDASEDGMEIVFVQPPPAVARGCWRAETSLECAANSPTFGEATLFLPQAAADQRVQLRSGVFITRSLTANFAPHGAPLSMAFRSRSQVEQLAAATEGLADAGATLRDAETAAIQREAAQEQAWIALLEARARRAELENPEPEQTN